MMRDPLQVPAHRELWAGVPVVGLPECLGDGGVRRDPVVARLELLGPEEHDRDRVAVAETRDQLGRPLKSRPAVLVAPVRGSLGGTARMLNLEPSSVRPWRPIGYVPVQDVSSSDRLRQYFWRYADEMVGRA